MGDAATISTPMEFQVFVSPDVLISSRVGCHEHLISCIVSPDSAIIVANGALAVVDTSWRRWNSNRDSAAMALCFKRCTFVRRRLVGFRGCHLVKLSIWPAFGESITTDRSTEQVTNEIARNRVQSKLACKSRYALKQCESKRRSSIPLR